MSRVHPIREVLASLRAKNFSLASGTLYPATFAWASYRNTSVPDEAGAATQLTSSPDGLLATLTDPKGNLHQFTYDSLGRLIKDQDPAGGFLALTRTEDLSTRTYRVAVASALGRTSAFQVQQLSTGDERRVNTDPAGLQRTVLIKTDGSDQTTDPDGMTATRTDTGDPRWGMMAPVPKSLIVATPGGLP